MYQLVSAIAKPLAGNGLWQAVNIGSVGMSTLYATYARVIATLTNPFLPDLVSLDLEDIRDQAGGLSATFNQYLTNIGSLALPTSTSLTKIDPKWVKYADAFMAGYKVKAIHPTASDNSGYPPSELTYLRLTRPSTDYTLFVNSCLVSVNGFIHPIDGNQNGVIVKWGNRSAQLSGVNTLGIMSFRELGSLTQVPITDDMIFNQMGTAPLKNHAYVKLGQDVSNKTVMLVLGGYLHLLDQRSFFLVNSETVAIDFNNIPMVERYYESKKYIDLSGLPLPQNMANPNQIALSDFFSDANLRAYLTLPQSFFVLLDQLDVAVDRDDIRQTKMDDKFTSHELPVWPLVVGYGKQANYWAVEEDTQWSVNCRDSVRPNYLFNTVANPRSLANVSNARDPNDKWHQSKAFFLKISSQLARFALTKTAFYTSLPHWNSVIRTASAVLSNNGFTVMSNNGADYSKTRSSIARSAGRYEFEVDWFDGFGLHDEGVALGLCTSAFDLTDGNAGLDGQTSVWGFFNDGNTAHNGVYVDLGKPTPNPGRGRVAVDFDAGKMWFGNESGYAGNPVAGTGAAWTFPPNTSLYLVVYVTHKVGANPDSSITGNFGQFAPESVPLVGFKRWFED